MQMQLPARHRMLIQAASLGYDSINQLGLWEEEAQEEVRK